MKKVALSLFTALVLALPNVEAAPLAENPAAGVERDIVHAGSLRLQSQRLAKLWLQAGLGIQAGAATGQLARGAVQFDRALAGLEYYHRNADTRRAFERISELWTEYRIALSLPYSENNLKVVNYLADDLMLATGRLTMKIEAEADGATGRLLDLSMRQNMLAQRLARLYLMAQAGDRSAGRLVDIEQARKEFSTALSELINARENTLASREALELASVQWMFFDGAISEMKKGKESRPQHVATASERIMETLDAVSQQYAKGGTQARYAASSSGAPGVRRN